MPEAYIYITLPSQTAAVTTGRFERTVDRNGVAVGRFVYGRRYRESADALEIDPVELRLTRAPCETERLGGVFGALRDAGPDNWGQRVIASHAGGEFGELGYLLHSPDERAGALGFGLGVEPPAPVRTAKRLFLAPAVAIPIIIATVIASITMVIVVAAAVIVALPVVMIIRSLAIGIEAVLAGAAGDTCRGRQGDQDGNSKSHRTPPVAFHSNGAWRGAVPEGQARRIAVAAMLHHP